MLLLTLRDLQYRRVRFIVVTVLAAVVFALLFLMTGLVEQFHREPEDATRGFGAQTWALAEGVSGPFTASATVPVGAALDVDAAQKSPIAVGRGSMNVEGKESEEVIVVGQIPGGLGSPALTKGRGVRVTANR